MSASLMEGRVRIGSPVVGEMVVNVSEAISKGIAKVIRLE